MSAPVYMDAGNRRLFLPGRARGFAMAYKSLPGSRQTGRFFTGLPAEKRAKHQCGLAAPRLRPARPLSSLTNN
jgi:hypothetical protein